MLNEIIFFTILSLNLLFIYIAKRLGPQTLMSIFILNIFLATIFAPNVVDFLGMPISLSALFYAPLFIIIQLIHNNQGHQEAIKAVYTGFGIMTCFFILAGIGIYFIDSLPETAAFANALNLIFKTPIQVFAASLVAYTVGQHINVYLHRFLKNIERSPIWFKHNVTNTLAQAVDSVIFYPLAFVGILTPENLILVTLTGWVMKSFVAFAMTPLAYVGRGKQTEQMTQGA